MQKKTVILRAELEARIEAAIELLDQLDGSFEDEPEVDADDFHDLIFSNLDGVGTNEDDEPAWDFEPDECEEDSLVPVCEKVALSRVRRDAHGVSAADTMHRNTERERRISNGSGRIARLDYGPFNPARDEFRIVPRNYDRQRRVRG